MSHIVILISRLLMSAVFIRYGWMKLVDVNSILANPGTKRFMDLVAGGAAPPTWLGYLIAAIELLGGIAILVGFKTRWVAWGLALWVVITTYFGHPFWTMDGAARAANMVNFYKNLAIIGGYILLAVTGGGDHAVDKRTGTA
jgi:putative oxidoreductase